MVYQPLLSVFMQVSILAIMYHVHRPLRVRVGCSSLLAGLSELGALLVWGGGLAELGMTSSPPFPSHCEWSCGGQEETKLFNHNLFIVGTTEG